jgi:hypothetical protein
MTCLPVHRFISYIFAGNGQVLDDPQIICGMFCVDCIIKGFKMRDILACFIPHHLTKAQKGHCYTIAKCNLECYCDTGDTFLQHIVVLGETWAQAYEPN